MQEIRLQLTNQLSRQLYHQMYAYAFRSVYSHLRAIATISDIRPAISHTLQEIDGDSSRTDF